jgi:signal transduction histidine kinase
MALETERARSRVWLAVLGGWLVWGSIYAIYLRGVKTGSTTPQVLHYAFSDAILWALATPLVWWLARRFPIRSPQLVRSLLTHAVLAVVVAFAVLLLDAVQDHFLGFGPGRWDAGVGTFVMSSLPYRWHSNLLLYGALVAIGHWLEHQRKVGDLRANLAEARLQVLRSQLQPHFLFNCLNTISGLVESRPAEAQRMIGRLSELLRLALKTNVEDTIPLCDELRLVETYLALEKTRFGGRLGVEIDVDASCGELPVPAMLLQPLVENSVQHGLAPRPEGGTLTVAARRNGGRLELSVRDDGVGLSHANGSNGAPGIGLSNARSRLSELYGDRHTCDLRERPEGGTEVAISIPIANEARA